MSKNLCSGCGKNFRSVSAFDKHRVGKFWPNNERRCLSDEEMISKGFHFNSQGKWSILATKSTFAKRKEKAA